MLSIILSTLSDFCFLQLIFLSLTRLSPRLLSYGFLVYTNNDSSSIFNNDGNNNIYYNKVTIIIVIMIIAVIINNNDKNNTNNSFKVFVWQGF